MEYNVYNPDGQLVGYCDENGLDALIAEGLYCVASENIARRTAITADASAKRHPIGPTFLNHLGKAFTVAR